MRANLDGTNLTTIVKHKSVTKICLDHKRKKIFFADEYNGIISVDYEGKNEVVFKNFEFPIMNLEIIAEKLFWQPYPTLNGLKSNRLFFYCNVNYKICENHKTLSIYRENLKIFKGHVDLSLSNEMKNPCEINNGYCSDLCLLTSAQNRRCACHLGSKLNFHHKVCSPVTDFIMYTENNIVKAISVENPATFKDIIIPKHFTVNYSIGKNTVDFDYDLQNDNFIFSDGNSIYIMKIVNGNSQKLIASASFDYHINDISLDQLSNNLYYFEQSNSNNGGGYLRVLSSINSNTNFKKTLLKTVNSNDQVFHLYVWENLGNLIYTRWENRKDIHSMKIDGSKTVNLHPLENIFTPNIVLGIDYDDNQLYFVDEHKKEFISHVDLDFNNFTMQSHFLPVNDMKSLYINKQHIYVSNQTSIWRMDKNNNNNSIQIVPKYGNNLEKKISGVKLFSTSRVFNKTNNPCAYKNGNCQQFCFSRPEKSCGCEDDRKLDNLINCIY